ncbi:hypothetical protein [Hymenobacter cellulosilyticus]|uniref:Uncharacterized protein n=1 Tax=Hymenobacter cellulosilyticus TaxID=2932248 RepID=A0A8T9QAY9_9BACT|nr:hypothetical protein [Hymenobacter cellulosilyticus]UOQ72970.1 hypothetical protein MUN79_03010 [Hymenobacter cellulosilyticus]
MKSVILRVVLLLACCGQFFTGFAQTSAQAARPGGAPADTVAGEARITRLFTQRLCEQIDLESRHQDFSVLTKAQGMGLLQDMLTNVIIRDSTEFNTFVLRASSEDAAVQRLSINAVLGLRTVCPLANKLLVQLGIQMTNLDTNLSASQQQIVRTVALDLCGQMAALNSVQAFSRRLPTERLELYYQARIAAIRRHGQTILIAFGDELLNDARLEDNMWLNVDQVMFEECPDLTGLLRVDRGMANLQKQSKEPEPAQPTKATPARRGHKK